MNGSAPKFSATGSHVDPVTNRKPNFSIAAAEPHASCHPTKKTSATTASAIASVSKPKTLSPTRDGGGIRAIVDLAAGDWIAATGITRLALHFDLVHPLQDAFAQIVWQRRIVQISRHHFTFSQRPFQKLDQLFAFGRILLLLVNEKPGRATNRVRRRARRVRD